MPLCSPPHRMTTYTPAARSELEIWTWVLLSRKRLRSGALALCAALRGRRRNVGMAKERTSMQMFAAAVRLEIS
jgi:hypothetical protein